MKDNLQKLVRQITNLSTSDFQELLDILLRQDQSALQSTEDFVSVQNIMKKIMEKNRDAQCTKRIFNMQGGHYYEHADIVVNHNHYNSNEDGNKNKPIFDLSDTAFMRPILDPIVSLIKNSRQWFPLYRILVDGNYVKKGDFVDFQSKMQAIYDNNLPIPIDIRDLSKLEVQSFALPFNKWNIQNAPVQGNTFNHYNKIGEYSKEVFGIIYLDE